MNVKEMLNHEKDAAESKTNTNTTKLNHLHRYTIASDNVRSIPKDNPTPDELKEAVTRNFKQIGTKQNFWNSLELSENTTKDEVLETLKKMNEESHKKHNFANNLYKNLIINASNAANAEHLKGNPSFNEVKEAVIKAIGEKVWEYINNKFPFKNPTSFEVTYILTELQKNYNELPKTKKNNLHKALMAIDLEPLKGKSLDVVKAAVINIGGASLWQSLKFPENITGDELIAHITEKKQKIRKSKKDPKNNPETTPHAPKKRRITTTSTTNEEVVLFTHEVK